MTDDVIGTIQGTATFEAVRIREQGEMLRVAGEYGDDPSATVYEVPHGHLYIGGLEVSVGKDPILVEPDDADYLWVEATDEGELHITEDEPDNDKDA